MLRPAGTAKFGDRYIDVVTEGDFIPPGTPVQVVEVEGTRIVVLTGAGISAESGVPTFRDSGGLWEGYSVEDVATRVLEPE